MTWHLPLFEALLFSAVGSTLLLVAASVLLELLREPARRTRVVEVSLVCLVVLPLLAFIPGYPRIAVLPAELLSTDRAFVDATRDPAQALSQPSVDQLGLPVYHRGLSHPSNIGELGPEPETASESNAVQLESAEPLAPVPQVAEQRGWRLPPDGRLYVVVAYLAGVAVMVVWSLLGLTALGLLIRSAGRPSEFCRRVFAEIAGPSGNRVELIVSRRAVQPCALWWRRSKIVLPIWLSESGDANRLRFALAHEWSHVARGDLWLWSLSGIVRWFYFYQPLVWYMRRHLRLCQDYLADDAIANDAREDYAQFLTECSATTSHVRVVPGLGMTSRQSELQRRILVLLDARPLERRVPRRWNVVLVAISVFALSAAACVRAGTDKESGAALAEVEETRLKPLDTIDIQIPLRRDRVYRLPMSDGKAGEVGGASPALSGIYVIEPNGDIALPYGFGRVNLNGMNLQQAGLAIRQCLTDAKLVRTALPNVRVTLRGKAVFAKGNEPSADYRIRPGDSLLVGHPSGNAFNYVVDSQGNVRLVEGGCPVAGKTLAEADVAMRAAMMANTRKKWEALAKKAMDPQTAYDGYITIGGWQEDADPSVIDTLEGKGATNRLLEEELRELREKVQQLQWKP